MRKKINWINLALLLASIGLLILLLSLGWIFFDERYFTFCARLDSKTASQLGGFLTGFVGLFWSASGIILIYATFEKQKEISEKQHFESKFFSLINTYHQLVENTKDSISKKNKGTFEDFKGRDFFSAALEEFRNGLSLKSFIKEVSKNKDIPEIKKVHDNIKNGIGIMNAESQIDNDLTTYMMSDLSKEFVIAQYEYFYKLHQTQLGHLFRYLYNIFKLTIEERQKYSDEDKYISLIQAQLSNDELVMLFYNGVSHYSKSKSGDFIFFNWLDDYKFFENIDISTLLKKTHIKYYPNTFQEK